MAEVRSTEEVLETLFIQAACLWGEEYAERIRPVLRLTAEQIAVMAHHHLPPSLEPLFFA
ncbi:MAG: hypothetical protein ACE5JU_24920 [Candidatus Binatia bacterium]